MKKRNGWIIALMMIGVIGMLYVEGVAKPQLQRQEQQEQLAQLNPLTHDIAHVLPYKSKYMGNAGNLTNLNNRLPLYNIAKTYQLYPDQLTAEISYEEAAASIDEELRTHAIVYNSTANFVLIDNLQVLKLNFQDDSYTIRREAVERWYGDAFNSLQEKERWEKEVSSKLSDQGYVKRFMEKNVFVSQTYNALGE
ncbi:DUF4825 domain-containing protein [Brevibacillus humidisoli]|uniref:DUF4825 domain-containing protein n=1 Tax=Brevibacillus humidisoli TaxID=2895522 RepID=UPI001E2ABF61|nr:DUF4825 domain-containing protein [Brevibacillus humidisoli]UFJ41126.1 DUF4825 domain-containing protein [Brevibacillus humidisoli]